MEFSRNSAEINTFFAITTENSFFNNKPAKISHILLGMEVYVVKYYYVDIIIYDYLFFQKYIKLTF